MFGNTIVVITKQEKEQKPHTVLKLASILLRQFFKPNNLKKFDLERTTEAVPNEHSADNLQSDSINVLCCEDQLESRGICSVNPH